MQYQEISLEKLITYFDGSATASIRKEIEEQRTNNPDFADEFEDWEAFLEDAESREAGIEKMKSFSQEWLKVDLDTSVSENEAKIVQFKPEAPAIERNSNRKPLFFRLAIAACFVLIAGVVIILLTQNSSPTYQVDERIAAEMQDVLSPKAGIDTESFNLQLTSLLVDKEYDQVLEKIDALIDSDQVPNTSEYVLVKALTLSLDNKNEQAITTLQTLDNQTGNSPEFACKVKKNMARVYGKLGDPSAFEKIFAELTSKGGKSFACTDVDKSLLPELELIKAGL